jgi:hypothetical protein
MRFLLPLLLTVSAALGQPAAPTGLVERTGDGSVILHWDANTDADLKGYHIYRATAPEGPFEQPIPAAFRLNHFVDFDVDNGQPYYYYIRTANDDNVMGEPSDTIAATPDVLDDEAFINLVQQTAFDYFWYEANPANGLVKDRSTDGSASSIAAVGFGLSALTVGIDRGWLSREAGRERVLTTLEFFWNSPQGPETDATGYKGFFYHFLNMQTGRRSGTTELSTIDTALLLGGVLHAGRYFGQNDPDEERIRALSDSLYERVDWAWAQVRPPRIGHGWRPESGHIAFDWGGYNEAMIVYLLALGSPTHPVAPEAWAAWTAGYDWETHYGYTFVRFPPLFGHQYTHTWYDFRDIQDAYMRGKGIDYFENSRRATLAQRAYAAANPKGFQDYAEDMWGFTPSDTPSGYRARGAPPAQNDDGTLTPTAPGGSFAFTPVASLAVLRNMYDTYRNRLWSRYGFRDAFNPGDDWYSSVFLGIDQGPIVLMIENYRTGRIWDVFMEHEAVQRGLERAGFTPTQTGTEGAPALPEDLPPATLYPNPATGTATLAYTLPHAGRVSLKLYDLLGREVATPVDAFQAAGPRTARLSTAGLAPGVYLYTLRLGAARTTGKVVVSR